MSQDISKVESTCDGYLAYSASAFVAFQKEVLAGIEEERLRNEIFGRIALIDSNSSQRSIKVD